MSVEVARTTTHEANFIRFCQDVADELTPTKPFWNLNLDNFDRIFRKYLDNHKSHLPILAFIDANRKMVEQPVLLNSEPNDKWLTFPSDEPAPKHKSLGASKPRGVYLSMKDDDWNYCLPLAEIYTVCVDAADLHRKTFYSVSIETVPALFLKLFFKMLLEVEPENPYFKENLALCEDLVAPVEPEPSIGQTLGSIMNSDGAKQLQGMLQGVASSFDEGTKAQLSEGFTQFQQNGDLGGLFASMQPFIQQSGISQLLSGLMPPANRESVNGTVEEEDSTGDAEDQE